MENPQTAENLQTVIDFLEPITEDLGFQKILDSVNGFIELVGSACFIRYRDESNSQPDKEFTDSFAQRINTSLINETATLIKLWQGYSQSQQEEEDDYEEDDN